jgi:hypothetical protein
MANMTTGSSLANGGKRNNRAKAQVDGRFNSAFSQGQGMANDRKHPTDTHKKGQHHTTDDGARA